jgi:hypothetical protein
MASEMGVHFTGFAAEYETIVDRAREIVAGFPPLLRDLAEPLLPELGEWEFSHIVALLPYWVADLLDGPKSRHTDETGTLGLATLLGWWSYSIQDQLLDRDLDRPEILPLAMAFYAVAIRLLVRLLPGHEAFWAAYQRLSLTAAKARLWEQRRRFGSLADLDDRRFDPEALDLDNMDRLANRSALLQLAVVAQCALRNHDPEHPHCKALMEMLHHYAIARQIGDDRTDWVEDLQNGKLNYVSTRIVRRMMETGAAQSYAELDADWMAGYSLYDDELFADIQRVAMTACQRAAQTGAGHDSVYLGELVSELAERLKCGYKAASHSRRELRAFFQT